MDSSVSQDYTPAELRPDSLISVGTRMRLTRMS